MAQIKIGNVIYGSTFASDITYKNTTVEKQLDLMPIFDVTDNTNVENDSNDYLTYANILDSLNSSDTDKALSANQGRILNEKFDNIDFSELENGIAINSEQIHNLNLDLEDFSKSFNNEYISNCDVFEEIEKEITKRGQMSTFCLSFGGDLINAPTDSWIWFSVLYKNARIIAFNKDSIAILHRNNGIYDSWKIINPDNITSLNNKIPFSFGIDANGNYGYIKDGADTVTPFSQIAKGTSTYSGYSKATKVTLGWKPRAVMAYCTSGNGYIISWFYAEGLLNHNLRRSSSNYTGSDMITTDDTGFSWTSIDATWGTQTITYIAIR